MNLNDGLLKYLFPDALHIMMVPWYVLIPVGFAVCLIGYLLGSINTAIIVSRTLFHEDVRTKGSGNAGLTNMLRNYGAKGAILTLVGDILKTALAIVIAAIPFGFGYFYTVSNSGFCYLAGLFAIIGHIFPVYYKFKGGKGVLVSATMALILSPIPFAILLTLFVIVVAISKYVSLGSVIGAILYPIIMRGTFALFGETPMSVGTSTTAIILACLVVYCHRENLRRISNRTERKLSFKKKSQDSDE